MVPRNSAGCTGSAFGFGISVSVASVKRSTPLPTRHSRGRSARVWPMSTSLAIVRHRCTLRRSERRPSMYPECPPRGIVAAMIPSFGKSSGSEPEVDHRSIASDVRMPVEPPYNDVGEARRSLRLAVDYVGASRRQLSVALEPPRPSFMLLSLLGFGANLTTAYLFRAPAKTRWSFRAALAHELSDAASRSQDSLEPLPSSSTASDGWTPVYRW